MTDKPSLLAELQRRSVLRIGAVYAAGAWLLVQVATQVFPFFHTPEWVVRWIVLAAVVGFPFALTLAWFYELTPAGLRRDAGPSAAAQSSRKPRRLLDIAVIAALAAAVVLLVSERFVRRTVPIEAADRSIAVLPFVNTSGDQGNEYFSDGLSEELINTLGRLRDLRVIGRTSSFAFKGHDGDIATIATKLGVTYLLEGSVRKAGERVRVAVELVRARDGSGLWSQTYERELKDIFAVQTDIATQVATQLQGTLVTAGAPSLLTADHPPSGSVEAFNALLRGNYHAARNTAQDLREAIDHYLQATSIDPAYAIAYARLSLASADFASIFATGTADIRHFRAQARDAAATALRLAPDDAESHLALGNAEAWADADWRAAVVEVERAAALAPQDGEIARRLGRLQFTLGRFDEALVTLKRAVANNPMSGPALYTLGLAYMGLERFEEAEKIERRAIEVQPERGIAHYILAATQIMLGRTQDALASAAAETDPFWRTQALAVARYAAGDRAGADEAMQKLIADYAENGAAQIAALYAQRGEADAMYRWLEHARAVADSGVSEILYVPFFKPYRAEPRFVAFARSVGIVEPAAGRPAE